MKAKPLNLISDFLSKKQQCLFLLKLCASTKQLFQIQAQIYVSGLSQDTVFLTQLVYFYALSSFKNLNYARTLVHHFHNPPLASWNMLIRGYASSHYPIEAIWIFQEMRNRGITCNQVTFSFLLKSCAVVAAFGEGRQLQAEVVKCGLESCVYVQTNLINFYGSCKKILDAERVFDEMPARNVVSWNSVITACVENLWFKDGIGYFVKMRDCGFEPDETTMIVMLSACAELGNLSLGQWVHSQVILRGMVLHCQLGTALVGMYAKSGAVGYARFVFDRMEERNVYTWNAMIFGLAQHGFAKEALALFHKLSNHPTITPNSITYLGVLCACSLARMVNEGYQHFLDMQQFHGIRPMLIHYGAMVDILGRAGYLREAYDFIQSMPIEPHAALWRTLLRACTIYDVNDHIGIGHKVRRRLLQWEKAANARRAMKDWGLKKMAGRVSLSEMNPYISSSQDDY